MNKIKPTKWPQSLVVGLHLISLPANAEVQFTFPNGNQFDTAGIGANDTLLDPISSVNVTLTTVDIRGQDGSLASTLEPDANHLTNSTGNDALGVASATNPGGYSSQSRDFNPGEAWTFSFDVDVSLVEMDFAGWTGPAEITMSSPAFADLVLTDDGSASGTFDLGANQVPAGTPITIAMTSDETEGNDTGVRLVYLTVAGSATGSTGADLLYNGGVTGIWDLMTLGFLDGAIPTLFSDGDNVLFDSAAMVTLGPAEIVAGRVEAAHDSGSVTLDGGLLTADRLENTGTGNLLISNDTLAGVAAITEGSLTLDGDGILTAQSLLLSNGARFEVLSGGVFYADGVTALGEGGGYLEVEDSLTLGAVSNDIYSNPLIKEGPGVLSLTDGLGTQTTGPVALELAEGGIEATGTGGAKQINVSGGTRIDGSLILDGPLLMVHGTTIEGQGEIRVKGESTIKTRLNQGAVEITVPLVLDAPLMVEAQSGDNDLTLSGAISGDFGLTKGSNGLASLTGSNDYMGDTRVVAGTLALAGASLADSSSVYLEGNGVLALEHGAGDTVAALYYEDEQMPAGSYGSSEVTEVTLDFVNDLRFSGSGYLIVTEGPVATDYDDWAASYMLADGRSGDSDGDGLDNGTEYAFGLNPTEASSRNAIQQVVRPDTGTFSYTRRNPSSYETGLSYSYAYSTTLREDGWTDFTSDSETVESSDGGDPVELVTVTLPAALLGNEVLFVRVTAQ
ncbi:MAG: hypothetical protein Q7Q71_14550 [Verrucomicrobiota bacterium JB023]|nr:hypothetical protein [Verrucomicrobiota bacterium JB023]